MNEKEGDKMNLSELENLRKKARNTILGGIIITAFVTIIMFLVNPVIGVIVLIAGIITTSILGHKFTKSFSLSFKETYVLKSLQTVFTDLDYKPEYGIEEQEIRSTQMMNMGDRYSSNDFISAKYKNVNFVQSDVHIEEKRQRTDSNGRSETYWVTLFKGRWMIFDFNKDFKANIQVRQKGFGNAKISNWGKAKEEKFKKISLEDLEFNKQFKVYAQSEHDAFYVLTPSLMRRIIDLSSNINGKILLCFVDNKLHIGLQNNKDSFEHSVFKQIIEEQVIDTILKDIKVITSFVDDLNLDNDLFKKER